MFALNINCAACVKKLREVPLDQGVQPNQTIIVVPGVQAQHSPHFGNTLKKYYTEHGCRLIQAGSQA